MVALVALDPAFGLERNLPNVAYAQSETAESTPATAVTFPRQRDFRKSVAHCRHGTGFTICNS